MHPDFTQTSARDDDIRVNQDVARGARNVVAKYLVSLAERHAQQVAEDGLTVSGKSQRLRDDIRRATLILDEL